jgi:hypothetical protein
MGVERERAGWGGGGQESKVSAGSAPNPSHGTKMLGKMPLTKKAHKKSHVQEQRLVAGPNHQAGQGKMVQHQLWARRGFFRKGRLRKLVHVQ